MLLYVKFAFPDGLFMSFQLQYLCFNYTLLQCVCLGVKVFESLPDLFFVSKNTCFLSWSLMVVVQGGFHSCQEKGISWSDETDANNFSSSDSHAP